ncbi:MAG: hypothetical protein SFU98_13040 [Leptospiraceae bacterium]|nr:hypothetical protein [Leptospiraceae bacterium]
MNRYFFFFILIAIHSTLVNCNSREYDSFKEVPFLHEHWTKHTHVKINLKTEIYSRLGDKNYIDYCQEDTISEIQKFSSFFYKLNNQMIRQDRILITCGTITGWIKLSRKNLTLGNESDLLKLIGKTDIIERFKRSMMRRVTLRYFRLAYTNDLMIYLVFVDSNSSITELFPEYKEVKENEWIFENENTSLYIVKTNDSYIFKVLKDKKNKLKFLHNQEYKLELVEI